MKPFLFLLLLLLSVIFITIVSISVRACNEIDKAKLLAFSSNLTISEKPLNWSNSTDCCTSWEGIDCDSATDRVTAVRLSTRGLAGTISSELAGLSSLSVLDLSRNSLSDSLPPEILSATANLQELNLSYNRLRGKIPSAALSGELRQIDLSSNLLDGAIQGTALFGASLGVFNVSNNSFSGEIPDFCGSSSAATMRVVDFSLNKFSGGIPIGVKRCSVLEIFRAGFNLLSGSIPDELYDVVSLQEVSFAANRLSGTISDRVVSLQKLRVLELFSNQLTGDVPIAIGRLSALQKLLLHINALTGQIPVSVANLTNLLRLNLRVNLMSGNISNLDFSGLKRLTTLDLGNNMFTGQIPASLFACESLTAVRFTANKLKGEIPPEISSLKSLSFLSISNNSFSNITRVFDSVKNITSLTTLAMSMNFLNEEMPEDESIVVPDGFQSLRVLAFGGCNLRGRVPNWLAKLKKLQVLDMSVNQITGTIPGWLGSFPNLFYLDLSSNRLSGGFPKELCALPALTSDQSATVTRPYLELPVFVMPNNATNQQYNQLSNLPSAIYLSNNSLSGEIPDEIGQLKYLQVLELSRNNFTGPIPDQFSNLTNLERLDLSRNDLTGEIPSSLKTLHFLSYFSVAFNDLHGPVPSGGQFDTFGSSSYEGNPRLCGPLVVQRSCSSPSTPVHEKKPKKKLLTGIVVGTCLGVGFVAIVLLALWILSTRRILPGGDNDKIEFDTVSGNSNVAITPLDIDKETSVVVLFSNNTNYIKDLSLVEILKATENFNQANIIGCGGFGLVYKATLADGTKLAIKKLSGDLGLMEREFKAEVEALSAAQHENLVSLQGYCVHDGYRLLIYSYMENGSLDFWLHENPDGPSELNWPIRLKILQGASLGLAYMHRVCEPHIVHRDIKSSNILLDEKFEAHVADFGLSRLILPYQTHVTTELVGTLGYIPPEYGQAWVATLRGDMYSFGVVMLEMLTGKRPVEVFKPRVSRELVAWVLQMRCEGKQAEVFDDLLRGKGFDDEMIQVLDVACMCVNYNPFKRPNIQEVVDWLKKLGQQRIADQ